MLGKISLPKYLLVNGEAAEIFEEIKFCPIVDLHTHLDVKQIYENRPLKDLWEAWGSNDHYVWELMRRCGVQERLITGDALPIEKWRAFATIVPKLAGNPVYDWLHLDLRLHFGIEEEVNVETADFVWEKAKNDLQSARMYPQALLKEMGVDTLCITEFTTEALKYYNMLNETLSSTKIFPSWRPDVFIEVESDQWKIAVDHLAKVTDTDVSRLSSFLDALEQIHSSFCKSGAFASDHAFEQPFGMPLTIEEAAKIFDALLCGKKVSIKKMCGFKAFLLFFFAELNIKSNWIMQLHVGAVRDYRSSLLNALGKDSGGDVADHMISVVDGLRPFLNSFDKKLDIVIYVLHPSHVYTLATIARAFPNVFIGAPWWFMDNPYHIREELLQIANVDVLSIYLGMVSDSRKLLSLYSRFDVFRRILANVLGEMVKAGRVSLPVAKMVARNVAYSNQKELVDKHRSNIGKLFERA